MDKAKLKQLAEQYTEEYYFETPVQFFMAGAYIATREVKEKIKELEQENKRLKNKIGVMQSCHFNSCIGCNSETCEVKE